MPVHDYYDSDFGFDAPFHIVRPTSQTAPLVFCSPHSGRHYTRYFLQQTRLDPLTLRKSEDSFVDTLFEPVTELGAPLICAQFPRAFLDVNREPYELDPRLFSEDVPEFANAHSTRVVGGLGTIARIVADGEEIYERPLPLSEAFKRIEGLYVPFHDALRALLKRTKSHFGYVILVDCHSMPSASASPATGRRPDIVLGDRFGASCREVIVMFVKDTLERMGYRVQVNRPYAGGYISENYGQPADGAHALQLEVNRGLYLDEARFALTPGFEQLQSDLMALVEMLIRELPEFFSPRAAAE